MPKEYIEREALTENIKKLFCADCNNYGGVLCRSCMIDDALMHIDDAPAADVTPVVHGEWNSVGDGFNWCYKCSVCGWKDGYPFNDRHKYCPNCGAKMKEEQ